MRVQQPNMSNHQTRRRDNSKCGSARHWRLGVSSHGVWQGVHVGTLVHAMHHADAVPLTQDQLNAVKRWTMEEYCMLGDEAEKQKGGPKLGVKKKP